MGIEKGKSKIKSTFKISCTTNSYNVDPDYVIQKMTQLWFHKETKLIEISN